MSNFFQMNNFFMPGRCCTPFAPRPMFMPVRPMFMPMGTPVFNGYGCFGYNRSGDYLTALTGLSLFNNILNNVSQTFAGNTSQSGSSFSSAINNEERIQAREERKAERAERRAERRAARVAKRGTIEEGKDPSIKPLGGIFGKLFPKVETRHYAKKALGKDFISGTKEIAKELNCKTNDLIAVMNQESSLNPTAVNKKSGASGLLQFTPQVAKELGTTVEEIRQMSAEEQLPLIREYLVTRKETAGFAKGEKLSGGDLYALVLAPARAKGDMMYDSIKNRTAYNANKSLDFDGDGQITKLDLDTAVENKQVELTA